MVWSQRASPLVLKLAVVKPPDVARDAVPSLVLPSWKVTVPAGVAAAVLPGMLTLTVAVKVTLCPAADGLTDDVTLTVVAALLTVCAREALLVMKYLSPL